jgi:hypothetical protein
MKGNALTQPATQQRGVKAGNLKVHRIGDVLPDGRVVAEVDEAGRLLLVKRTPVAEVRL